jgi:GT2 family glycosyltransferase
LDAIQAGFKVVYQPKAVAIHHESAFRGAQPAPHIKERMDRSWNYFQEKHAGLDIASLVPTLID